MSEIERVLEANTAYRDEHRDIADAEPTRRLAIVTCMDARIDVLAVLGLEIGEAHVIRNAGGRVTDDVLRSLALSSHALGTDTVVVMEHTRCGVAGTTNEALRERVGADLDYRAIADHDAALRDDVEAIVATPYLSTLTTVSGALFDLESGEVTEVLRRERTA